MCIKENIELCCHYDMHTVIVTCSFASMEELREAIRSTFQSVHIKLPTTFNIRYLNKKYGADVLALQITEIEHEAKLYILPI